MLKKSFLVICLFFNLKNNTMLQKTFINLTKKELPSKEVIHRILTAHFGCSENFDNISSELAHKNLTQFEIDTKLHRWYFGPTEPYFPKLSEIAKEIHKKSK